MKKIFEKILTEYELVSDFGTQKQKTSYIDNGHFVNRNKENVLKNARCYCDVEELGQRQYKITNVKLIPHTKDYEMVHDSLYQYICPLILKKLIDKDKIVLTVGKWAREIDMVNENYHYIKLDLSRAVENVLALKENKISEGMLMDFYNHCDSMIYSYFTQALGYMKKLGLILWQEVYMISYQSVRSTLVGGKVDVEFLPPDTHRASEDEINYYTKCIAKADKMNGITCDKDRYYSKRSNAWRTALNKELSKKKIQRVFKSYEVYAIDKDKCQNLLHTFEDISDDFIDTFNNAFIEIIFGCAVKRYERKPEKCDDIKAQSTIDYADGHKGISQLVIGRSTALGKDEVDIPESVIVNIQGKKAIVKSNKKEDV